MDNENFMAIERFYTNATVIRTEKWLKQQAKDGWKLVRKKGSLFTFRRCATYEAEYFMYSGFDKGKGISFDYRMARKLYSNNRSEINKSFAGVFEADINKIDSKYEEYKKLRNDHYKKYYMTLSFLFFPLTVIALVLSFSYPPAVFALVLSLIVLIYAVCSLILFIRDLEHTEF